MTEIGCLPYVVYLSSVSQNVLKFYQQLTGEERMIPCSFDDIFFYCSRVRGLIFYTMS